MDSLIWFVIGIIAGCVAYRMMSNWNAKRKLGQAKRAHGMDPGARKRTNATVKSTKLPVVPLDTIPELRSQPLPTDEELLAQQAKRRRAVARKQPKEAKIREPQRRTTWADIFGEETPQQWQPVQYTSVANHRTQLKQQLADYEKG